MWQCLWQAQPRGIEAYLKQYGEELSGEHPPPYQASLEPPRSITRGGEVFGHRLCIVVAVNPRLQQKRS
jgi:hypothetical protein